MTIGAEDADVIGLDPDDGSVERAAAEVVDEDRFPDRIGYHVIMERRRDRFGNDAGYIEARDFTGLFRRVTFQHPEVRAL